MISIGVSFAQPVQISTAMAVASVPPREMNRDTWQMPPLDELPPGRLTATNRVWLFVLRAYLIVAAGLVLIRIVMLAFVGGD